jgi:DNA-binding transcriptional regulator LsrR (DeoR family)
MKPEAKRKRSRIYISGSKSWIRYLDGNSYQEVADILGISHTNVATKISRLKQTLRRDAGAKYGAQ